MHVLVLQHIACEPPGVYEDVLRERGAMIHRVELDEGEHLPKWQGFDAIIAMGGPMSVNDDDRLPWLRDEKVLINEAVRGGVPFFGACLGVQLLAASLGGTVFRGPAPEVGLLPVSLTSEAETDPVFAGLPSRILTFQWHGDTFSLPTGSVLLASSPAFQHQAFRWGNSAYGVQFHLEVSLDMAKQWLDVPEYAQSLNDALGAAAAADLITQYAKRQDELRRQGRHLFERWLDLC
ncbi:MAG: type 1 glutamine amidotransferase [Xanthobacteraceae bacterium]